MTYEQIYQILVGRKVYFDDAWHVYDADGNELSDPAGVMWRAIPGALLMWPREEAVPKRRSKSLARFTPYREEPTVSLKMLREEDNLATDLIVALVTKGFLHDHGTSTS